MKLLLLENDAQACGHIEFVLREAGHAVDVCAAEQDAILLASSGDYAVLVFDRTVPRSVALPALTALRVAGVRTPALFLTAMNGVEDRVEGLEAGAADHLAKPFAATELLARVDALARRTPISEVATVLTVGDLVVDRTTRTVVRAGQRIDLQPLELKLLECLMLHVGDVVTRTMLLEKVWSFHFEPRTNVVEGHMNRLRAKVDRGPGRELIRTVRNAGYRISAD